MVQSRQGLRISRAGGQRPGRGGYLRAHGNGPAGGTAGSRAGTAIGSADRSGQEGPDRNRGSRRLRALAALMLAGGALALAACQPTTSSNSSSAIEASPAGLEQVPLTITTAAGKVHRFIVEVARTEAQQAQGLMNRQTLAPDRGMIFPYATPTMAAFWMKNTLIP